MKKADLRRQELVEKLADHILAHGLQASSLRPLAAAAGTSDRMLLHYFSNKEELLEATLTLLAARLTALLESARSAPMPIESLLPMLAGMLKEPRIRPYLSLWLELAARAAADEALYRDIGRSIGDGFYTWIAAALQVEPEEERPSKASLALAMLEGLVVLDAFGLDTRIESALDGLARQAALPER